MEKDASIVRAVAALEAHFGDDLLVADHWDADLMAIGVSARSEPARLVYLSTFRRAPGRFYAELELPSAPGSAVPYEKGEVFADVDLDTLTEIVARHLGLTSGPAA